MEKYTVQWSLHFSAHSSTSSYVGHTEGLCAHCTLLRIWGWRRFPSCHFCFGEKNPVLFAFARFSSMKHRKQQRTLDTPRCSGYRTVYTSVWEPVSSCRLNSIKSGQFNVDCETSKTELLIRLKCHWMIQFSQAGNPGVRGYTPTAC